MTKTTNFLVFLALLVIMMSSVMAFEKDGNYHLGDGLVPQNLHPGVNDSAFTDTYTPLSPTLAGYPTSCDAFGIGISQHYTFDGNKVYVHGFEDGTIQQLSSYSFDPSWTVYDIFCVSGSRSSFGYDTLYAIVDTTSNITIQGLEVVGATNDNFESLTWSQINNWTFDSHTPQSEVHCSGAIVSSTPLFQCVYTATNNRIYTFGTWDEEHEINISDSSLDVYDEYGIGLVHKPHTVISSYGSENYQIGVMDFNTSATRWSATFLDLDGCNSSVFCNINNSYYDSYHSGIASNTYYLLNNMGSMPIESSASYLDGKYYYGEYALAFNELIYYGSSTNHDANAYFIHDNTLIDSIDYFTGIAKAGGETAQNYFPFQQYDTDEDGNPEYCFISDLWFYCAEQTAPSTYTIYNFGASYQASTYYLVGQYYDDETEGLGDSKLIVWNTGRFRTQATLGSVSTSTLTALANQGSVWSTDTNKNDNGELIFTSSVGTYIYYVFDEDPDTILYDDTLTYDGLYGFYNPGQNGTTQYIRAKQCDEDYIDCTYGNENEDISVKEKLCTTCGGTINETCGVWSFTTPYVTCTFNNTGTYDVTVTLYTTTNEDEIAQTFEIEDWVINSDPNSAVNLVQEQDPTTLSGANETTSTTPSATSVSGLTGVFAVIQNNIQSIFSLLLIVAVIGSIAGSGVREPVILLFVGVIMSVLMTIIGFLDAIVMVLILLTAIIMIFLSMTVFKTSSAG